VHNNSDNIIITIIMHNLRILFS